MNNRGRIQSQGGGIEESENWAKNSSLTICEGKTKLSSLKAKHSKKILKERSDAFTKLESFMHNAKSQGGVSGPISKSYPVQNHKNKRIDLEVQKGKAFV